MGKDLEGPDPGPPPPVFVGLIFQTQRVIFTSHQCAGCLLGKVLKNGSQFRDPEGRRQEVGPNTDVLTHSSQPAPTEAAWGPSPTPPKTHGTLTSENSSVLIHFLKLLDPLKHLWSEPQRKEPFFSEKESSVPSEQTGPHKQQTPALGSASPGLTIRHVWIMCVCENRTGTGRGFVFKINHGHRKTE